MELKDFKIKSESEDSYHVEHPSGRSFTFMKSSMSPKALAMVQKLSKGGEVQHFDNGGDVQTPDSLKPTDNSSQQQVTPSVNINVGDPNNVPESKAPQAPEDSGPSLFEQGVNTVLQHAGLPPAQAIGQAVSSIGNAAVTSGIIDPSGQGGKGAAPQQAPQAAPPEQQSQQAAAANPQSSQPANPLDQFGQSQNSLFDKEQQQLQGLSKNIDQSSLQAQQAYQDFINKQSQMKTPEQIADEYKQKDDAFAKQFANSQIDPNRYFKNQSTGSKILSSIGIILSGLGAGAHGTNMAMENINRAVANDIEAQKNDQSKAMNLWRMNRENMQSDMQANIATQNQLLTGVQAKMAMSAGNIQNTQARMNLQQAINDIEQKKINNRMLLSSGGSGPSGGLSSGAVNYNKFNAMQRAGIMNPADVTAATKEANDVEAVRALRSEYVDSFKKLSSMTAAGALSPNQREGLINALAAKIAKQSAGRFNLEESQQIVKGMFPSKTDVGQDTTNIKFNKGLGYFNAEEAGASTLKRYGLLNPAPAASLSQEGATGTYQGKPVIMRNGQWVYR